MTTQIIVTAILALKIAAHLAGGPWASRSIDRLRNPVAITAWALTILTLAAIVVAVWSAHAAAWFGHVLDAIGRQLIH